VGQTPWSAADAPVGLRPQTRGSAPPRKGRIGGELAMISRPGHLVM
jgi:hypothetical protein